MKKACLTGATLVGIIFGSLGVSGCGENCKLQVGSGLPAERPVSGCKREEYDRQMDRLKWAYQEEMRIQRIITPQSESVNGYLPLGGIRF